MAGLLSASDEVQRQKRLKTSANDSRAPVRMETAAGAQKSGEWR
jgi:hypothetical protein